MLNEFFSQWLVIFDSKMTPRYLTVVVQGMSCPAIVIDFKMMFLMVEKDIACVFFGFMVNFQFLK
mgnify:CR=1 FL=1